MFNIFFSWWYGDQVTLTPYLMCKELFECSQNWIYNMDSISTFISTFINISSCCNFIKYYPHDMMAQKRELAPIIICIILLCHVTRKSIIQAMKTTIIIQHNFIFKLILHELLVYQYELGTFNAMFTRY